MSIPDELRNIRNHLSTGAFGQREIWERQLERAASEIERLQDQAGLREAIVETTVDLGWVKQ